MEWKQFTDKNGNPFEKFDDGTNRQITIHYDKDGNVTSSHVKNPDGSRQYVNPADAWLGAEFINKLK